MRKAKDVIGLPVIAVDSGKQVGQVRDLRFGSDWRLRDIVLEAKSWFSPGLAIHSDRIVGVGDDAVTVDANTALPLQDDPLARTCTDGRARLLGLPVVTANGRRLGIIEDVYFQPNLGKQIVCCEISEGFISDLQEGRKLLPIPEEAILGEDAIIVPALSKDDVQEHFVSHE